MPEARVLLSGIAFGEQPRWHDGRLWFSDWGAGEVIAADLEGNTEVMVRPPSWPCCVDWLPDGQLLVVSGGEGLLLYQATDASLAEYADLNTASTPPAGNELVVDGRGNAYINGGGFNLMAGDPFKPGVITLVTADRERRMVADDLAFPNGMLITPDNKTLIVAESYAKRLTALDIATDGSLVNRRVWAELGDGVPDGICLDADGAVWYSDVPNKRCVRVREGGDVLQTIDLDRGCFACALGGPDGTILFLVATEWTGTQGMFAEPRTGQLLIAQAPAPAAGWP